MLVLRNVVKLKGSFGVGFEVSRLLGQVVLVLVLRSLPTFYGGLVLVLRLMK